MATWQKALTQDPEAIQGFTRYLESLRETATREMEEAPDYASVMKAAGKKKVLDQLVTAVRMDAREEQQRAGAFGTTRVARSA